MKISHTLLATLTAVSLACSVPTETETDVPQPIDLPVSLPAAVTGAANIGNAVTVSDNGWQRLFGGSITVESDATVIYAMVFGGNDAPVYDSRTNVMFFSSGQTARQNRLEFEPTYGGGYESPPYTQWFDIGNVYAVVK